jgi:carbon-monoxide dehydrogenase medium subunit
MAVRLSWPTHLVDIAGVAELSRIAVTDSGVVTIGAATLQRTVERSAAIAAVCPVLPEAISHIGHFPIRNRGTVGGSLVHGDPASELPLCALALDAQLRTRRADGRERVVDARDFFVGPLMTDLEADELLLDVRIPAWPSGAGWGFQEFSRRSGDFAIIAVLTMLRLAPNGTVDEGRIAIAGAGPTPLRPPEAEAMLAGERAGETLFVRAGAQVAESIEPHSDIHGSVRFRRQLAASLTERALADAHRRVQLDG